MHDLLILQTFLYIFHIFRAHPQRQEMDRRRLEAAHLKYACLRVAAQYPEAISLKSIKFEDVMETLCEITPTLFSCFEARYAGMYACMYDKIYYITKLV